MSRRGPAYRVVLNEPDREYAVASATVYTHDAAMTLARHYLEETMTGGRVRIWIPEDSRDAADYEWVKGRDEPPDTREATLRKTLAEMVETHTQASDGTTSSWWRDRLRELLA